MSLVRPGAYEHGVGSDNDDSKKNFKILFYENKYVIRLMNRRINADYTY
jgi:hypothetical protein